MRFGIRLWFAGLLGLLMVTLAAGPSQAKDTLFDQLGGQKGVDQIADHAASLFSADDRVKADFDNINPHFITPRLAAFLCKVADGPCIYRGRSMAAAHEGLELTRAKFNAVAEDLQKAMQDLGVPYRTQNQMMARLAPLQRDIVTK